MDTATIRKAHIAVVGAVGSDVTITLPDGRKLEGFIQHVDGMSDAFTMCKHQTHRDESGLVRVDLNRVQSITVHHRDGTDSIFS